MKKALAYGAALIAVYLIVVNGTNSGTVINGATSGGVNIIKAFQGR